MLYEGYKFDKIEKIVLYAIAEKGKPSLQEELYASLPEIERNTIEVTLRKLERSKLIRRTKGKKEKNSITLNQGRIAMEKIKKTLKDHWEPNFEINWKNVTTTKGLAAT